MDLKFGQLNAASAPRIDNTSYMQGVQSLGQNFGDLLSGTAKTIVDGVKRQKVAEAKQKAFDPKTGETDWNLYFAELYKIDPIMAQEEQVSHAKGVADQKYKTMQAETQRLHATNNMAALQAKTQEQVQKDIGNFANNIETAADANKEGMYREMKKLVEFYRSKFEKAGEPSIFPNMPETYNQTEVLALASKVRNIKYQADREDAADDKADNTRADKAQKFREVAFWSMLDFRKKSKEDAMEANTVGDLKELYTFRLKPYLAGQSKVQLYTSALPKDTKTWGPLDFKNAVFAIVKGFDPDSAVLQGELDSWLEEISISKSLWEKLKNENTGAAKTVSAATKAALIKKVGDVQAAFPAAISSLRSEYRNVAAARGFDPDTIVYDDAGGGSAVGGVAESGGDTDEIDDDTMAKLAEEFGAEDVADTFGGR